MKNGEGLNGGVIIDGTIPPTSNYTIAIAFQRYSFQRYNIYFVQWGAGTLTNHLLYSDRSSDNILNVDEYQPSGGSLTTDIILSENVVVVFSRNANVVTFWVDGIKIGDYSHSEVYSGTTPTKTYLGYRPNNPQNVNGMAISAMASWGEVLSDANIESITMDSLTAF